MQPIDGIHNQFIITLPILVDAFKWILHEYFDLPADFFGEVDTIVHTLVATLRHEGRLPQTYYLAEHPMYATGQLCLVVKGWNERGEWGLLWLLPDTWKYFRRTHERTLSDSRRMDYFTTPRIDKSTETDATEKDR